MDKLLTPIRIKNVSLKNRMVLSPMCMYSSEDGFANDFHLVHLGSRAVGGFGLVMQEATAVSPEGRITYRDLGIWKDEHQIKLTQIVDFVHSQDGKIGIQLAHAGRKASTKPPFEGRGLILPEEKKGWETVAPSPIPFRAQDRSPKELNNDDLKKIKNDFVNATRRAKTIGYDVLEIHAAHGYLLHQFLSPVSNKRTDKYGGSLENRMRFVLEVVEAIIGEWGDEKAIFVRISATDWVENGWKIDDAIEFVKKLGELGIDLIDVSSSGSVPHPTIPIKPGYQVALAEKIKKETHIITGAVGLITTQQQAEEILLKGQADFISFGREALRNPYFPMNTLASENEANWIKQYAWAIPKKEKSIP